MPRPTLLHKVKVTISPVDKASTPYDEQAREPIREARKSTAIIVWGQQHVTRLSEPENSPEGIVDDVRGHITVVKDEIDRQNYTPKRSDKITKIGKRDTLLFIVWWEDMAHYTDQGGATLMRLYYSERRPSAQAPSMG